MTKAHKEERKKKNNGTHHEVAQLGVELRKTGRCEKHDDFMALGI